jgi:hypothetical protein
MPAATTVGKIPPLGPSACADDAVERAHAAVPDDRVDDKCQRVQDGLLAAERLGDPQRDDEQRRERKRRKGRHRRSVEPAVVGIPLRVGVAKQRAQLIRDRPHASA